MCLHLCAHSSRVGVHENNGQTADSLLQHLLQICSQFVLIHCLPFLQLHKATTDMFTVIHSPNVSSFSIMTDQLRQQPCSQTFIHQCL